MTKHGPPRDGPNVCLHNAPIDAVCLECERWALSPDSPIQRPLRLVEALENLALNDQRAHLPLNGGAYVVVTKCECKYAAVAQHAPHHYYASDENGTLVVVTRHMVRDAIAGLA